MGTATRRGRAPPYTDAEKDLVAALYPDARWRGVLLGHLPDREPSSVAALAGRLGLARPRREWSIADSKRLEALWPTATEAELLAAFPGRSWRRLWAHAHDTLRLAPRRRGRAAGLVGTEVLARAQRFDPTLLRGILAWAGIAEVQAPRARACPGLTAACVPEAAALAAIRAWLALETGRDAAARLGVTYPTLGRWRRQDPALGLVTKAALDALDAPGTGPWALVTGDEVWGYAADARGAERGLSLHLRLAPGVWDRIAREHGHGG